MRRTVAAILILSVFLCLQYGKIATYLYCKWQAEIVLNKTDCGCDDHLVTMFDHEDSDSKNNLSKITITGKLNEFTPKPIIDIVFNLPNTKNCFTDFDASLKEGFIAAAFHPPLA